MAETTSPQTTERLRFERTFNLTRLGGAAITFLLGPLFPNIGIAHVILFGTLLLVQTAFVAYLLRSGTFERHPTNVARLIFGIDLLTISYAILLFSYDPNWSTYIVGLLLIIAGGFRFASARLEWRSLIVAPRLVQWPLRH